MSNSICIVRLSALGDVLMIVPLIRTLQSNLPGVSVTWIISPPAYDLVAGMDGVEFIVINKPNSLADYWRFKRQMQGRHFDVLLAAQASFRANLLYPLIRAKRKIGYDSRRAKDGHRWFIHEAIPAGQDHTLEGFLKFAGMLGIDQPDLRWNLPINEEDFHWAEQYIQKKPVLIVNPAASKPERSWLVERYIEVILHAQNQWDMDVILTGGPGSYDRSLADAILTKVSCTDLVGKTKPKQLLALISKAHLVLCPDTGPAHMAVAVGTAVIALHAVTNVNISGPYLYKHLAVDCYLEALEKILKKTLDKNSWGTQVHGEEAMKLISIAAVLAKFDLVMNR